ncbi:hypothetical protein IKE71_01380 [Candidatus Saccharibacteria bacterium]|nr:hypothetical protein [Candidatus Saccharibacteria bacterium]
MLFPANAKARIAKTFYDKTVKVYAKTETVDREGGIVNGTTVKGTFKGNVRFNSLGELQSELGLTRNIDIAISCPTDTKVEVDDLLEYKGIKYVVTDALPRDSHKFIMGEKWRAE